MLAPATYLSASITMIYNHLFEQIYQAVLEAQNIVTVSHRKPDGDTLGGSLGFYNYLLTIGKKIKPPTDPRRSSIGVTPFCTDKPGTMYNFMPGYFEITDNADTLKNADLICVFDAGDLRFANIADLIDSLNPRPKIINFDHHAVNERFGNTNLVIEDACSTTDVVWRYLKYVKFSMTREVAICLLTGIISDTSHFYNPATSPQAFAISSELIRAGANINVVARALLQNKSMDALRVWGIALQRLRLNQETGVATTILEHEDIGDDELTQESVEGLSNFLGGILRVKATMVLKSTKDGYVKGSLRTTRDDIDISKLAKHFGGGGHKKAAGFIIRGEIKDIDGKWEIV